MMLKRLGIAILLGSLSWGAQSSTSDIPCEPRIILFWQDFASRHGSDTIPAFLIQQGCLSGPLQTLTFYETAQNRFGPDTPMSLPDDLSYEAWYYQTYYAQQRLIDEDDEAPTASASYESIDRSPQPTRATNNTASEPGSNNASSGIPRTQHSTPGFNLQIQRVVSANPWLLAIIVGLIAYIVLRRTPKKADNKVQEYVQCHDCGSLVRAEREQCFVCGSYLSRND